MPKKVSKGSDYVEYVYLANGEKLAKKKNGQFVNFYCGSFVYKGDKSLEYIAHGEGLALKEGGSFSYQYNLTDHLGNVRNVLNAGGTSIQSNDYYPFGLTHNTVSNFAKNKYLYNGKEAQDETIGGTIYNVLDYHARRYDPVTGRMHEPDPMQEKYINFSSYAYCINNPLRFIDPDGMNPDDPQNGEYSEDGQKRWREGYGWIEKDIYLYLDLMINSGVNVSGMTKNDLYKSYSDFIDSQNQENVQEDKREAEKEEPTDYYTEVADKLVEGGGKVMGAIPVIGDIYKYGTGQISMGELVAEALVDVSPFRLIRTAAKAASVFDAFGSVSSSESEYNQSSEHTKNKRKSSKGKHQKGKSRKKKDKGGEKGDARRTRYK